MGNFRAAAAMRLSLDLAFQVVPGVNVGYVSRASRLPYEA